MTPDLELTEILPAPPGESPFHARGIFYDHVLKHAAKAPGGVPAFLAEIKDERVREFMKQRFKWSDWYDALPMTPVQVALCRREGADFATSVQRRARIAAESLVPRLFRVALGMGNPKVAAEHVPRLLLQNYDFAQLRIEVTGNQGVAHFTNLPRILAPGFIHTTLGLVEGGLRLMGVRAIQPGVLKFSPGAKLSGYETINGETDMAWTK